MCLMQIELVFAHAFSCEDLEKRFEEALQDGLACNRLFGVYGLLMRFVHIAPNADVGLSIRLQTFLIDELMIHRSCFPP